MMYRDSSKLFNIQLLKTQQTENHFMNRILPGNCLCSSAVFMYFQTKRQVPQLSEV